MEALEDLNFPLHNIGFAEAGGFWTFGSTMADRMLFWPERQHFSREAFLEQCWAESYPNVNTTLGEHACSAVSQPRYVSVVSVLFPLYPGEFVVHLILVETLVQETSSRNLFHLHIFNHFFANFWFQMITATGSQAWALVHQVVRFISCNFRGPCLSR